MKFAALVLLLAVGSQAASLQADAPDQVAHIQTKVKEFLVRVLEPFDTTSWKASKDQAIEMLVTRLGQGMEMGQTVSDATAGFRGTATESFQAVRSSFDEQADDLRAKLQTHLDDYMDTLKTLRGNLEPKKADVEEMKTHVRTAVEEFGEKVKKNWEETRESLAPIANKVKEVGEQRLAEAKAAIAPYITEYIEKAKTYYASEDTINPEELKTKLSTIFAAISELLSQQ